MSLYKDWITKAYDTQGRSVKAFWDKYMPTEQKIYEGMLAAKDVKIQGTVGELAAKHNMPPAHVVGFIDGIKDTLDTEIDVENLTEGSKIDASTDFEKLYKKMVQFKAKHLYEMEAWGGVFTAERREALFKEQKESGTVKREAAKIGRNDPCPCGSGKKYKQCCGIGSGSGSGL